MTYFEKNIQYRIFVAFGEAGLQQFQALLSSPRGKCKRIA
jgi:hypothetical protein